MKSIALALALSLLATAAAAQEQRVDREPSDPTGLGIGEIEARLWYENTGRLSDNVLIEGFNLWNTVIGEGSADEPASSLMVGVRVFSQDGQRFVTIPLVVDLVGADGEVIQSQSVDGMLTSGEGQSVQGFFFRDVTCLGDISIRATLGAETLSEPVGFVCGE